MEEHRFDHHGVVLNEILGLITCRRGRFAEWAQVYSPCEDDVNRGLVGGRVEGRTGVQVERVVESEVVLRCKRNNNDGACDMLCEV